MAECGTILYASSCERIYMRKGTKKWINDLAATLYYKDIGSRKGLTVAQSNIEYEGSADNIKGVYTSKAITDVRKLVTEGYIKIERGTQDVSIATEKAGL